MHIYGIIPEDWTSSNNGAITMTELLTLTRRTLLVLCGSAASGKSTFAAQRFPETMIVSSDRCRGIVCDDENSQMVNQDAFDLFFFILQKRLKLDRFSVADSVALQPFARRNLLKLSRSFNYSTCLLIFNVSFDACLAADRQRTRQVGERVLRHHADLLTRTLRDAPQEGWDLVRVLQENERDLAIRFDS